MDKEERTRHDVSLIYLNIFLELRFCESQSWCDEFQALGFATSV
jgi:hypothetical protein